MRPILRPASDHIYSLLRAVAGFLFLLHGVQKLFPVLGTDDTSVDGSNPAICGHRKSGHFRRPETGVEFYFIGSCSRKDIWTLVRQLRGPHLRMWA